MKVYVVTQGQYSETQILGVVDDKEKIKLNGQTEIQIHEFVLNIIPEVPPGQKLYHVIMDWDGKGETCEMDLKDKETLNEWVKDSGFGTHLFAEDAKHAIKIANEKRVQLIAERGQK